MLTNNAESLPVGTLVTICLDGSSTESAARVVKSTRRSCTVARLYGPRAGELVTFRLTTADAGFYTFRQSYYLTIGEARQHLDLSA